MESFEMLSFVFKSLSPFGRLGDFFAEVIASNLDTCAVKSYGQSKKTFLHGQNTTPIGVL